MIHVQLIRFMRIPVAGDEWPHLSHPSWPWHCQPSHAKDLLQQEQKKAEVQVVETQNEAKAAPEQLGQHW